VTDDVLANAAIGLLLVSVTSTMIVAGWSRRGDPPGAAWLIGPALLEIFGTGWVVHFHGVALARAQTASPEAAAAEMSHGLALAMTGSATMYFAAAALLAGSALWLGGPGRGPHRPRGPHRIFVAVVLWQALGAFSYATLARAMGAMFTEAATSPPEIRMQLVAGATGAVGLQRTMLWAIGAGLAVAVAVWTLATRRSEFEDGRVWVRATAVVGVLATLSLGRLLAQQMILGRMTP